MWCITTNMYVRMCTVVKLSANFSNLMGDDIELILIIIRHHCLNFELTNRKC